MMIAKAKNAMMTKSDGSPKRIQSSRTDKMISGHQDGDRRGGVTVLRGGMPSECRDRAAKSMEIALEPARGS